MKIIRDARLVPRKSVRLTCYNCHSVLEVTNEDATDVSHCQRDGSYWIIPCGVCRTQLTVAYEKLGRKIAS